MGTNTVPGVIAFVILAGKRLMPDAIAPQPNSPLQWQGEPHLQEESKHRRELLIPIDWEQSIPRR
jgi:hypothetical protein